MPKAKVSGALYSYTDDSGYHIIQRGEVHDFPQDQYDRGVKYGVLIDPDEEPVQLGYVLEPGTGRPTINSSASDAELTAWVTSANIAEITVLRTQAEVADDQEFVGRIDTALSEVIDERSTEERTRLEQVKALQEGETNEEGNLVGVDATGETTVNPARDAVGGVVTQQTVTTPDTGTEVDPDTLDPDALSGEDLDGLGNDIEDPDFVVTFSVTKISEYLSNHPDQATAVLDAENRRVEATGEEPRRGVVRAVEAVAGSAG